MHLSDKIIEKMESSYHGFTLFAERTAKCNPSGLRGWCVRVLNREGTLLPDDVLAPWISGSEAQERDWSSLGMRWQNFAKNHGLAVNPHNRRICEHGGAHSGEVAVRRVPR
jgi:hypothetical protein